MHAPAVRRAERPGLAHEGFERALAGGGEDHLAHHALGTIHGGLGDPEQDAGLAAHLDRLLHQLLQHPPLGLDGDTVRDLDQQLDQAVHHLRLARGAPEGEQRQADALRVPPQLPGTLDGGAPAEALDLVGMHAAQQARWQRQAAQRLELTDLGEQALQPDPAGVGGQPRERRALAAVGEQRVQPPARAGIEAVGHASQGRVVVRGAGGAQDTPEPVCAGPGDPAAGEPGVDLRLQRRRGRLARQQLVGEPAAERGLGRLVEGGDREVVAHEAAVPAPGAAGPVVAIEHVGADADLGGEPPDHRRSEVRLVVGKAAVLAPVGELRGQAELAGVGQVGQQRQVLGSERPALAKLVRRPPPPHRLRPRRDSGAGSLRAGRGPRHLRWPKHTPSRSLGLFIGIRNPDGRPSRGGRCANLTAYLCRGTLL
jgi:hypothetical protein